MSLKNCTTLESYFTTYGSLLGARAVEAVPPLYRVGKDTSVDLSFISHADPDREPYPSQANVINALVRGWRTREKGPYRRARKSAKIISGEMGTGKTLLGAAAIHATATANGMAGYRVVIMCPNHLIEKWEREILLTVPGSWVRTFERSDPNKADDSFKEVMQYIDACRAPRTKLAPLPDEHAAETCDVSTGIGPHSVEGTLVDLPYSVEAVPARKRRRDREGRTRWTKPWCPEWVIVGRNQAKQEPDWQGLGERRFVYSAGVKLSREVGREEVTDSEGKPVRRFGETVMRPVYKKVTTCPKCGTQIRLTAEELAKEQHRCRLLVLREVGTEDRRGGGGLDRISPLPTEVSDAKPGSTVKYKDRTYKVERCGEHLYQWNPSPRKWSPARLFHKQARGLFDWMILDEMHEEKEANSGQAIAAGKVMKSARRILGLTGTLIGGYAHHLFPLLFRMAPASLVADGFTWGGEQGFTKLYGRIDTTIVTKFGKSGTRTVSRGRGQTSMRKDVEGDASEKKDVKPGVMPTFFGKHLIDKAVFISLDEMADDLPELVDDDRSLIAVDMDDHLQDEYDRIQSELVAENTRLLQRGSSKLLSAMLRTLLEYPDKPYGWKGPFPNVDAVGYFPEANRKTINSYVGVCQPADLDEDVVYAKEQALYEVCMREAAEGRQVWVYCTQTGKRDVQTRLAGILKRGGLRVKVLRSANVDTYSREAWIRDNGPDLDVAISHPELVSTGLDFFDKAGTFNFCTIVFYEGDYRVNLIRQAGRRHWRIGQQRECRTYYLYYKGTMQERQVVHVGEKYAASKSLEGKFSSEGLAALSGGGLAMTEMAKALERQIEDPRASWAKLRAETKAKLVRMHRSGALATLAGAVGEDGRLSDVAATILLSDDDLALLDEFDGGSLTLTEEDFALLDEYDPEIGAELAAMNLSIDALASA